MLSRNGVYVIYKIQHLEMNPKKWEYSNLGHFGHPMGFEASDTCWQTTGEFGVFSYTMAKKGLNWIRNKHSNTEFRIVCTITSQQTIVVSERKE